MLVDSRLVIILASFTMENVNINYSYKSIPIPNRYKLVLLRKIESFIRNMRWKIYFFLNAIDCTEKEGRDKCGFKKRNPPH